MDANTTATPNRTAQILALLHAGAASTADIASATGMSSALASAHLSALRRLRKVTATGETTTSGRRSRVRWEIAAPVISNRGSVAEISDADLLRRAVTCAVRAGGKRTPAWVKVMHAFALGSTFAGQLCERFGFDKNTGASA